MGRKSAIEWLEGGASWNWLYGCTKVAQGCAHCYAERVVPRIGLRAVGPLARGGEKAQGATYHGNVIVRADHLNDPLGWKKGLRVFVNSLSDTFHEDVPNALLDRAFSVMAEADQHTYLLLTKRPSRMRAYLETCQRGAADVGRAFPWPNVWGGISASTEKDLAAGLPDLLMAPLAKRFLSLEPLVAPIDARAFYGVDWVIVGGESGRLARPCKEEWIRQVVRACRASRVPVFVKQMGAAWAKDVKLATGPNAMDTKGNEPSLWAADLRIREVPR